MTKIFPLFLVLFVALLVPFFYGYEKTNNEVYYDLSESLPKDMANVVANTKLQEDFDMGATDMLLTDASLDSDDMRAMIKELEQVKGVKTVLGMEAVVGPLVPEEMIPDSIEKILKSDNWELYTDRLRI